MSEETDFNDLHQNEGIEAVKETIMAQLNEESVLPPGFRLAEGGIIKMFLDPKGNMQELRVCDALYVKALTRNKESREWGRLLEWKDQDGKKHNFSLPAEMLASDGTEYRRILLAGGLNITSGTKANHALHDYLLSSAPPTRALAVSTTGWHDEQYVAADGKVYGDASLSVVFQTAGALQKFHRTGTLEEWHENIGGHAINNSRLAFPICIALAGPLLRPSGEESGGFHISGASSIGKSTALAVASSVFGSDMKSWRTTDNAAESAALNANDGFLALDELSQVDSRAADQMAYMLSNGQSKGRAGRDGSAKKISSFQLMFLSTGEIGLASKLAEGNKSAKAGQIVRMLEVPGDASANLGIFEDIKGFENADTFAKHLKAASAQHRGVIGDLFLEKLVDTGTAQLSKTIQGLTHAWMQHHVPANADGQVQRAARRFALVAAAGELACSMGVINWPEKTASNAAERCFRDWLALRGGVGSHEVQEGLQRIITFLERYGASRFQNIENDERIDKRAGFKKLNQNGGVEEFLIFTETYKEEILGGSKNVSAISQAAIQAGLIHPDGNGRYAKPMNLREMGKRRVVCVRPQCYGEYAERKTDKKSLF